MSTLSIVIDDAVLEKVKKRIPARKISKFIEEAIKDKIVAQEYDLLMAYREASQDQDREEEIKVWDELDTNG